MPIYCKIDIEAKTTLSEQHSIHHQIQIYMQKLHNSQNKCNIETDEW